MFPWLKRNRGKIALAIVGVMVLSAAYYYGGNSPGLQGWSAAGSASASTSAVASAPETGSGSQADSSAEAAGSGGASSAVPDKSTQSTDAKSSDSHQVNQKQTAQVKKPAASGTESTMTATEKEAAAAKLSGGVSDVEKGDQKYSESEGMAIDPSTGKDKYQTDPVPEGKPVPVEPQDAVVTDQEYTCTLSISCATINDNLDWLDPEKKELVPSDGWILKPTQATFYEGESVFNVLIRTCKQQGIQMEYENTPIYNSAYIEGINNLYEFDCGELSGWMYKVNDWFPNYGCSRYQLHDGDTVNLVYTCNLGVDVGGYYSATAN